MQPLSDTNTEAAKAIDREQNVEDLLFLLSAVNEVRTFLQELDEYVYIPDFGIRAKKSLTAWFAPPRITLLFVLEVE